MKKAPSRSDVAERASPSRSEYAVTSTPGNGCPLSSARTRPRRVPSGPSAAAAFNTPNTVRAMVPRMMVRTRLMRIPSDRLHEPCNLSAEGWMNGESLPLLSHGPTLRRPRIVPSNGFHIYELTAEAQKGLDKTHGDCIMTLVR